jgi:DNA topoisomerase II
MESSKLSKQYQKKTDKEHILDNPDTYIGSVENVDSNLWLYNNEKIITKSINYIPGLYKLFDEGIVNCRDHVIRMQQQKTSGTAFQVNKIEINVDDDGTIHMLNDGNGIDVAKHPEYDLWIPEMIFGHLRTSTNYNKDEKKIVGGKNGFGFKLVLIWSLSGEIETVDHIRKLKYVQKFSNNLDNIEPPKITKCSAKPYTKVSFKPDYIRFGIPSLNADMKQLFHKRVIDISAITPKNVKVKFNNELIPVKSFEQYIDLYVGTKTETSRVYEIPNERWEYCVALSPSHEFQHVSFVNGIHTSKGGKHIDYILNQITKKMVSYIEKKKKVTVNANTVKEQLFLFVRCDIENPAFDSQTKDYMNTPMSKFGSSCVISDKFIEKLAKMGVMDGACALTEVKENKVAKKSDGSKTRIIKGIPKLIDANWAGTSKSSECTIIFCEGDSAKAGIVSGLSSEDRNIIGIYPMKGKILNVRGEATKKIMENKEIIEIKKILGLEAKKEYDENNIKRTLRYGRVLFMTDQDLDGSHIKGLCINLFQSEWNSLSKISNFIGFMNTPILKAKKGSKTLLFYNDGEYNKWKQDNDTTGWKIKYYKGLGTSTGSEFKEYFKNKKIVTFDYSGDVCDNAIDKVFNKKRADDRKEWLSNYNRELYLDTDNDTVTYNDFIDREMIHFSKYDCDRSIPNMMDGLKISLRKILYSAFKKNLTNEIKVAQFSGYVSEQSGYHHGEASLNAAIVGLAQNYVGSNNINLFDPNGQFGTRLQGGKDSASERYIYTQLNRITRSIFPNADDNILRYLDDDGTPVEPIFYAPIIPMVLVNGSKGIGTGFSTEILPYHVPKIVDYLKCRLNKTSVDGITFTPHYEGFKGRIQTIEKGKYLIIGKYAVLPDKRVRVTELPIGTWTDDYKQYLETLMETIDKKGKKITPIVKEYDDMSKSTNVDIIITFNEGLSQILETNTVEHDCNGLEKLLKLYTTVSTSNMHMFDHKECLKKYDNVPDIIDDYFGPRLQMYDDRKKYQLEALLKELTVMNNKQRYIQEILDETLDLRRKSKDVILEMMNEKGYDIINEDNDFKYLLKMSMDSVSEESVEKIIKALTETQEKYDKLFATSIQQLWLNDLDHFEGEYALYVDERKRLNDSDSDSKVTKKIKKKT